MSHAPLAYPEPKTNMSTVTQHLTHTILSRLRKPFQMLAGMELENMVYRSDLMRLPVNPGEHFSAVELRDSLEKRCVEAGIFPSLTVEPGGQIEFGGSPFRDLHQVHEELQKYQENLFEICREEDLILLDFALDPLYKPEDIIIIDQTKYHLMHERFGTTGFHGHWMMKMTASLQLNLDYSSAEEAAQLALVADVLQPFLSLLTANAPFMNGKPNAKRNMRFDIWEDTDPARCGGLLDHGITTQAELLTAFTHLVTEAPAIFGQDENDTIVPFEGTLGDWLESVAKTRELHSRDGLIALHQIFTHVRFKDILEIRTPDRPPLGYEMAPVAFITGLLKEPCCLDEVVELASSWSLKERREAVEKSKTLDLSQTTFHGKSFHTWFEQLFELSLMGLDTRAEQIGIPSERIYLEAFAEQFLTKGPFSLQIQEEFMTSGKSLKAFIRDRWEAQLEKFSTNI